MLFLFLLPLINSTPDLFFNGYPFNYMAVSLFYLAGIIFASRLRKENNLKEFPGSGVYLLFLTILFISVFFVFLRWSGLTLSWLAFGRDLPVSPSGERVSFAAIFPVVTLALFSLSPFLNFLLRRHELKENEIFAPLKAGFCLSFLFALFQRWVNPDFLSQSWWALTMKRVNGGFSDFNAFGFFAGVLFLYQALNLIKKIVAKKDETGEFISGSPGNLFCSLSLKSRLSDLLFLLVALAAIFISGSRTAFLFVLLALLYLLFAKKIKFLPKLLIIFLLAVSLLLAGGTLKRRLKEMTDQIASIANAGDLFLAADQLSNGRLVMLKDGMLMIGRFPISGLGAGNFLFYLKYMYFNKKYYEDMPLNQYLLIFSETGLVGGLLFVFFWAIILGRQRQNSIRFILAAIAVILLVNNALWLPEVSLLFWVFISRVELLEKSRQRSWGASSLVLVLLFVIFSVINFQALHPKTMARTASISYYYGIYYQEIGNGRAFRWTGENAGIYIYLDRDGRNGDYRLFCGAPLSHMLDKKQTVDIYWRGKFFKQVVFLRNNEVPLLIEDKNTREGFLEFRVHPAFNLKRMELGEETRDLGMQLSNGDR